MNDLPRQKLQEIVRKYDRSLSPKLYEALLRDLCGEYRSEISVLISALKEGVARDLLKSNNNILKTVLLPQLVNRLQENLGLAEEPAAWAVDSWAIALGIIFDPIATESYKQAKYESQLRQYELKFFQAIHNEYPVSDNTKNDFKSFRQSLGLEQNDVDKIERLIITQKETELKTQEQQRKLLKNQLQNKEAELNAQEQQQKFLKNQLQKHEQEAIIYKQISDKLERELKIQQSKQKLFIITVALAIICGVTSAGLGFYSRQQNQQINYLEERISSLESQVNERDKLTSQVTELSSQIDKLEEENTSLLSKIRSLEETNPQICHLASSSKSELISAAYAYWDGQVWRAKGWYKIEYGECLNIDLGIYNYKGTVYVHGHTSKGNSWGSNIFSFCVSSQAFEFENIDTMVCSDNDKDNYQVKAYPYAVYPGSDNYTFKK